MCVPLKLSKRRRVYGNRKPLRGSVRRVKPIIFNWVNDETGLIWRHGKPSRGQWSQNAVRYAS